MTSETPFTVLIWAFALILFYGALVRGFFVLASPSRKRMTQLGAELLSVDNLDDETKREITAEINSNFASIWAWVAALLVIPATLRLLWQRWNGLKLNTGCDPNSKLAEFRNLSLLTSLSNSPLALGLFAVQIALVSIFVRSATTIAELLHMMDSFHHLPRSRRFAS